MSRPLSLPLVAGIVGALVAGVVVTLPSTATAAPPDRSHGLLVFSIVQPGNHQSYFSVDNKRAAFYGAVHEDLLDAVEQAAELDLSEFEKDGRIKLVDEDTCLGVTPPGGAGTVRRAVAQPCRDGDADQEWRIPAGSENRLQNVGSRLWVSNPTSVAGWSLTGSLNSSLLHVMDSFLDGRPDATPRFRTTYDHATDTVTLHGRQVTPLAPVAIGGDGGKEEVVGTTTVEGTFSVAIPEAFSNRAIVDVRIDDEDPCATSIRHVPVAQPRFVRETDGSVSFRGVVAPWTPVNIGTGPLESDIVATGASTGSGGVRIPLPDAKPGDTYFVYQHEDGVRSRMVVPAPAAAVVAVDQPETELERGTSTPVPVGVIATLPLTSLTTDFTLTAPAGTVFTPGTTFVDGQLKPRGGDWQPRDLRLRIDHITISPDGRTLTASASVTTMAIGEGDEIRWLPTLDVVDSAVARASV